MSDNNHKPKGTIQTGDKVGTTVAVILFVSSLLTGALTIVSGMLKALGTFDALLFFIFFTPIIQGSLSVFVYKLTGQQIQDNNVLNLTRQGKQEDDWKDKEKDYKKTIVELEKGCSKQDIEIAELKGTIRFYTEVLNVNEWLKSQFKTSFGFSPREKKDTSDAEVDSIINTLDKSTK